MNLDNLGFVLTSIAQGADPYRGSIPKLSFEFRHEQNDIDACEAWNFLVRLRGVKEIMSEGEVLSYEKTWVGRGPTAEVAYRDALKQIQSSLRQDRDRCEREMGALEEASRVFTQLCTEPEPVPEEPTPEEVPALVEDPGVERA